MKRGAGEHKDAENGDSFQSPQLTSTVYTRPTEASAKLSEVDLCSYNNVLRGNMDVSLDSQQSTNPSEWIATNPDPVLLIQADVASSSPIIPIKGKRGKINVDVDSINKRHNSNCDGSGLVKFVSKNDIPTFRLIDLKDLLKDFYLDVLAQELKSRRTHPVLPDYVKIQPTQTKRAHVSEGTCLHVGDILFWMKEGNRIDGRIVDFERGDVVVMIIKGETKGEIVRLDKSFSSVRRLRTGLDPNSGEYIEMASDCLYLPHMQVQRDLELSAKAGYHVTYGRSSKFTELRYLAPAPDWDANEEGQAWRRSFTNDFVVEKGVPCNVCYACLQPFPQIDRLPKYWEQTPYIDFTIAGSKAILKHANQQKHLPFYKALPNLDTYLPKECNSIDYRTVGGEVQKIFCKVVNAHSIPLQCFNSLVVENDPVPLKMAISRFFGRIHQELEVGTICKESTYTEKLNANKQKYGWTSLTKKEVLQIYPAFRNRIEKLLTTVDYRMLTFDWRSMVRPSESHANTATILWNQFHVFFKRGLFFEEPYPPIHDVDHQLTTTFVSLLDVTSAEPNIRASSTAVLLGNPHNNQI